MTTWSPCGTAVTSRPFDPRRTKGHAPPTGGHRLLQIGRFLCPNFKSSATTPPLGTSPRPSPAWPRGWSWGWTSRPSWGSPAPAKPSPWPRSLSGSSAPPWCWPTTRRWPPSSAPSSARFSRTTPWNISSPTTTTTSRRPISPAPIPISKRTAPSTTR